MKYKNNDVVAIHSLGPSYGGKVFFGLIVGIAVKDIMEPAQVWIVRLDSETQKALKCDYNCITMPGACLRKA